MHDSIVFEFHILFGNTSMRENSVAHLLREERGFFSGYTTKGIVGIGEIPVGRGSSESESGSGLLLGGESPLSGASSTVTGEWGRIVEGK